MGRRLFGRSSGKRSLNTNKIFAKWLQKRVEFFNDDGVVAACTATMGAGRATMKVPAEGATGRFRVFSEDGRIALYVSPEVTISAGEVWELQAGKQKV